MTPFKKNLREKADMLPDSPGVYMWLDSTGKILYVGKAKSLRQRVQSYFRQDGDNRLQIPVLMSNAADIDFIVTGSETEALVTEANIARLHKPKYNVRLKDDKKYPYIKITREQFPRIIITRDLTEDGSRYLGPYTDVRSLRKLIELVHNIFPLRLCEKNLSDGKIKTPCLNFQIKKCSGPCSGAVSQQEYSGYVDDACRFIQGKNSELMKNMAELMKEASDSLNFELAAQIRDRIRAVENVLERRRAFSTERLTGDWDVINYYPIDNEACVVILEIRDGAIIDKKSYMLSGMHYTQPEQMLSSFITQYYNKSSFVPPEIHLPFEPDDTESITGFLSGKAGIKTTFVYPMRGEKLRLLKIAGTNAETILKETIKKRDRVKDAIPSVLLSIARDLRLTKPPRTIACIDISHFQGDDMVASLVFFTDGKTDKKEYRRFKIKTFEGIDDFMGMREVVERYFKRRLEEKKSFPDLLLVDGGKGQLSSALSVLRGLGLEKQAVAGLAKRLEEVFLPGAGDAQNIPKTSSSLHLLQRVRDEAHRFANEYRKVLGKKRVFSSALDSIEGIGKKRAETLLFRFGSVERIKQSSVEEIAAAPGIGMKRARTVKAELGKPGK